ncbi:hypothetical protein GOP47_0030514 [Adiantum capillus-veneris]|nr:hypothetical protein GOP47_0030315 [Adiantum capillus-veneris]KAI5055369.1 hypothetical protein GOP47_0030514 [Adiantum capillus-veneris]
MVGAARKDEEEEVAPPPTSIAAACAASILPRRILFHPPLRAPPPSSSSSLTPLNLPPPGQVALQHSNGDRTISLTPNSPLPCPSHNLPSTLVKRIGAGLNNLGNTCFLNSVLQCLTYTPPFTTYFQEGLHKSSCRAVAFCAMCALENHVKQALSAPGRVISPNQLVRNLRCISRSFHMGRQEDAHEYMRYLIEALQKCCPLDVHAKAPPGSQKNYIQNFFGGRLQSQVKCTECGHSSNTYDPFLDLSLDIVKAESLVKALTRFTAIEILDGDNKYFCSKCKKKVRAHKQFTIDCAPHVLTVQFKRFSSSGGFGGKIDKNVLFGRTLDLTPFVNGKEGGVRYSLYAVLVHSGWSTHSGHYFCFVRTSADIWHRLDDSRVSQVSEKSVLEQKAYILFYIRDSETAPTANGNHHVPANGNHHGNASGKFNVRHTSPGIGKVEVNGGNIFVSATHSGSSQGDSTLKDAVRVHSKGLLTADIRDCLSNGIGANGANANGAGTNGRGIIKERNMKEHTSKKLERQAAHSGDLSNGVCSDDLAAGVLSNTKISCDERAVSLPLSNAALLPVPCWEDGELNEGTAMKERSMLGEEVSHCGHVLDEWDEEYDRGKRKKIRSRLSFYQESVEVSEHMPKKRKQQQHSSASISNEGHDNLFQALAGKKVDIGVKTALFNKKRRKERVRGHKLFLKRHRFKQLHANRRHRRKR